MWILIYSDFFIQNSTAEIEFINSNDVYVSRTIYAVLQIYNATNLRVHALIRANLVNLYYSWRPFLMGAVDQRSYSPKSFTIVYERGAKPTRNRIISIGDRQQGDKLIYRTSKIIQNKLNWLSEADFSFESRTKSITSVEFVFDVSCENLSWQMWSSGTNNLSFEQIDSFYLSNVVHGKITYNS